MRLSPVAHNLLLRGEITRLLSMSFDEIIHPSDLELFNTGISSPATHIRPLDTVIEILVCPVLTESLNEPVVISSGHIFSKQVIEQILQSGNIRSRKCPHTREPLNPIGLDQTYFLRLPVIDQALQRFRNARDRVNLDNTTDATAAALPTPEIGAILGGPSIDRPEANILPNLPALLDTVVLFPTRELNPELPTERPNASLKIFVSSNKLRITISPSQSSTFSERFLETLSTTLSDLFHHQPLSKLPENASSYYLAAGSFGRCWAVTSNACKLEMWFPCQKRSESPAGSAHYRLTDDEVEGFLAATIEPLALPMAEAPVDTGPALVMDNLTERQQRDYFPLFDSALLGQSLSLSQVIACCTAFMRHSESFMQTRSAGESLFVDNVIASNVAPPTGRVEHRTIFSFSPAAGPGPLASNPSAGLLLTTTSSLPHQFITSSTQSTQSFISRPYNGS